ncbi:MAG TPA: glycosyltransferase family 39 protein [Acidimicrobiales bacterium]|nr:glycosyltransferase family 39 protein [Acidimicrobiales bacterium]
MRPSRFDLAALAGLVVVLALLWGRGLPTWYWTDEGLSLGISSHPLGQMRELLAQDTSPPLYHVFLLGWLRLFGSSEASTHSLSLLFALATVPAALWAGWSLFDRRTGWMAAGLAAASPFLAFYATETRMYSLVALLSLLTTATFLHAFVFRRRRFLPAFAVLIALLLYAQYWGIFFALGAGAAVVVCWARGPDRRRLVIDAALAFGAAAVLFTPWVPTLLYQRAHSAVGWALPPTMQLVRDDVVGLVGGPAAAVALALCGGTALMVMLRRPWNDASIVIVVAVVVSLVVVGAGWATSRASSQWHGRYLGILLGPLLLALGAALARAGDLAIPVVVIVGILSGPFAVPSARNAKSNVPEWVEETSPLLLENDVVFGPIGDIPLLAHYLPDGLRYATTTGPVKDPLAADWRDAVERLDRTDPVATLSPLVESLAAGGHVLVTCPTAEEADLVGLPTYIQLEIRRCRQGTHHLLERRDLRVERAFPHPRASGSPHETRLLTKVAPAS